MKKNKFVPDKQSIVSFSLMGPESGGMCMVDSNDDRITRIRPTGGCAAMTRLRTPAMLRCGDLRSPALCGGSYRHC